MDDTVASRGVFLSCVFSQELRLRELFSLSKVVGPDFAANLNTVGFG